MERDLGELAKEGCRRSTDEYSGDKLIFYDVECFSVLEKWVCFLLKRVIMACRLREGTICFLEKVFSFPYLIQLETVRRAFLILRN